MPSSWHRGVLKCGIDASELVGVISILLTVDSLHRRLW